MKKLLLTLLLLPTIAYGAVTFPVNGGTGTSTKPTFGQLLMGNANGLYDLVSTSSLGITGGTGVSNAYASSTFPSFQYATDTYATQASLGLYVPYSYATNTYYFASNPSGFITSASLTPYMTFAYATNTYMPLASSSLFYLATNPSGYITNSVSNLTNYPSYAYATNTYYFASNPSGYITSSALTPYVPYSYASTTFASTSWVLGTFVPFSYGSSTFPTFTYASTTFASTSWVTSTFPTFTYATATFATSSGLYTNFMRYAYASSTFPTFTYASSAYYLATNPSNYITNSVSNLTNYPTYTYATNTYVTYSYGSSTYGGGGISSAYASSSFVKVIDDQTITGIKTFNGTTSLATTTLRSGLQDSTNATGTSGQVLSSTGTSTKWITAAGGGEVTYAYGSTTYQGRYQEVYNQSYASQGAGFSTDTYLVGSTTTIPVQGLQKGSRYHLRFYASKTAAGTAVPQYIVRFGTNGSTADTARCTMLGRPQTAAADFAVFEVWVTFNSVGSGSSAVMACSMRITHQLSVTGFANLVSVATTTTSAGFDSTPAGSIIGVSLNGGTSASWTVSTVQAKLENLP